jgi:hypothetical protein
MHKETVRLSFDVPIDEHILYKTESVQSRTPIKDLLHTLVILGMKEYKKAKFNERMKKSIQQAKEGKTRTVSLEELDRWEKELEDDSK